MTDQQAARIIELLESIDRRLRSVIGGESDSEEVTVVVKGSVTVETSHDNPLATYESR